ncbi:MAG: aspartate 1-decarboxylase [Anaerolineaceae bacterium]|nr:aspartate 1-decarboxylase [Anaerolineaceae bacterium]
MLREMLIAKIHRATVTGSDLNYIGSITIDKEFMDLVGINEWQKVQIADLDNGNRLETYVIPGEPGSKTIQLNGAAARLVHRGDKVIIMAYGLLDEKETKNFQPKILVLDETNEIID